jgi:hypothetical protein
VGTTALSTAAVILAVALGGGAYVTYGVLATRLHRRGSAALVAVIVVGSALPALRTLWPGEPVATAALRAAGDHVALPSPHPRAAWVLVASNVGQDRRAWWAEYELGIGDISVTGELGRVPGKRFSQHRVPVRAPGSEVRARYHRVRLEEPISHVRGVRIAGYVRDGLEVSVFREPLAPWLAFSCWGVVLAAVTVLEAWWKCRGAVGLAATIPVLVSMLTWRYVTPVNAVNGAVRVVVAGTFVGTIVGCGLASIAALVMRRLRSRS